MRRGNIAVALILIIIGLWYLAVALVPGLQSLANGPHTWPISIIGLGLIFFLAAILAWQPALFIPGSIITGIGGLLYYQNLTGNWESWSYAWALIPGFVGIGLILFGLFSKKFGAVTGGLWNIFSSIVLFSVFGGVFGGITNVEKVWPIAIIVLGGFFLFRAFRKQ